MDRVVILPERSDVERAVAHDVMVVLADAIRSRGRADFVVTGGTVGIGSLAAIAETSESAELDWSRIHVWWGDERFVPAEHPDRNEGQATLALLSHVPVRESNIHRFPSADGEELETARERFDVELRGEFPEGPRFDLVLNGIGPDGHIASLFPGRDHGTAADLTIAVADSPKPPSNRLSLTFTALNSGSKVWVIASGADKATAISRLMAGATVEEIPVAGLRGTVETALYLDDAAASLLPR
jgi:6-phosphogluconolactonase